MHKSLRETWVLTLLCAAALGVFEHAFAGMMPMFEEQLVEMWMQLPFIRTVISAILGTDVGETLAPNLLSSMGWMHPIALVIVWMHAILYGTRIPAGEIDRGTVDTLMSLPVSRARIYVCDSLVGLACGVFVLAGGWIGHVSGAEPRGPVGSSRAIMVVLVNLICLYASVAGAAYLCSAMSRRRGRAIGMVVGFVLASFFVHSLAAFNETARAFASLSIVHHYQPFVILRDGEWPWGDLAALGGFAAACWTLGAVVFARRDIRTV